VTVELQAGGKTYVLGVRPWLMGIVNATPDSFSDAGLHPTVEARLALARELLDAGADVIDIGGESGRTNLPPVGAEEEIERVAPLIERVVAELGAIVSVDTYKPAVAAAAVAAGAVIVNDVSGLRDPGLADVCAHGGAALIVMHTSAPPKQRLQDPGLYEDVVEEVLAFLAGRIAVARDRGLTEEALIVDPGPDFTKTPAQTIELLRGGERLHQFGRPVLMALSRKDFIGALTGRVPRDRGAGTLAAIAHGLDIGAHIFRVHDVAAASDFITVRSALRGELDIAPATMLPDELRSQSPPERVS
jgi:dihydropteroate synthase